MGKWLLRKYYATDLLASSPCPYHPPSHKQDLPSRGERSWISFFCLSNSQNHIVTTLWMVQRTASHRVSTSTDSILSGWVTNCCYTPQRITKPPSHFISVSQCSTWPLYSEVSSPTSKYLIWIWHMLPSSDKTDGVTIRIKIYKRGFWSSKILRTEF